MNWKGLTFIDLLCVTLFATFYKYISIKVEGDTRMRLRSLMMVFMCVGVFAGIGFLIMTKLQGKQMNRNIGFPYMYIVGAAIFLFIAHSLHITVYGMAPNQGVVQALLGMSAVTVSIMSYFLFGHKYSMRNCFGIVLSIVSVFILIG